MAHPVVKSGRLLKPPNTVRLWKTMETMKCAYPFIYQCNLNLNGAAHHPLLVICTSHFDKFPYLQLVNCREAVSFKKRPLSFTTVFKGHIFIAFGVCLCVVRFWATNLPNTEKTQLRNGFLQVYRMQLTSYKLLVAFVCQPWIDHGM